MKFTISGVRKAAKGILKTYRPNLEMRKRTISFLIFFTIETFEKEKLHYKYRGKSFFRFFFYFFFGSSFNLTRDALDLENLG